MPLRDGDIEVLSMVNKQIRGETGQFMQVKEIRMRVRGLNEEVLYVPLASFSREVAEQAILRAAAEIVDILDRFPPQR